MEGRADTPEKKRAVIEKIYRSWCDHPHQRLGQLILNSALPKVHCPDLFHMEDEILAAAIAYYGV